MQGQYFREGATFQILIELRPYKIHVKKIFKNDYGENMIVYAWYGKVKQWWHYTLLNEKSLISKIEIYQSFLEKKERNNDS